MRIIWSGLRPPEADADSGTWVLEIASSIHDPLITLSIKNANLIVTTPPWIEQRGIHPAVLERKKDGRSLTRRVMGLLVRRYTPHRGAHLVLHAVRKLFNLSHLTQLCGGEGIRIRALNFSIQFVDEPD